MILTLLYLNERKFKKKIKIVGIVRNKQKTIERFSEYSRRSDLQLIVQNICKLASIDGPVDYIIHAASQASPKYYGSDPVGTLSANILGTYNLLELAKEKEVKSFLFFSAGEIYGQVPEDKIPIKEDVYGYVDSTNVRSCYAESKRMGETMCVCWHHQHGVPAKIVRPFHTYGPGMSFDDGRVFADFVSDIVNKRNIVMKSDGSAVRAFCYIADATIGFFTVLLRGESGQAYNIGDDKGQISILGLANLLVELFKEKKLRVERKKVSEPGYLKSDISRNCPDISKVTKLGWKPKYSLKDGFKRTVESYIC